jgi:guanine deaminase
MMTGFILHGDILTSTAQRKLSVFEDSYLIVLAGKIKGIVKEVPVLYRDLPILERTGKLILPGLCDLHLHAPQYAYRGTGMDLELLEWLKTHAFPEETKYQDLAYAEKAYGLFAAEEQKGFTTRLSVFATRHPKASLLLAQKLEKAGLAGYVGLVSMDRNAPKGLVEKDDQEGLQDVMEFLNGMSGRETIQPILTPRFVPSVTPKLMADLGALKASRHLKVQSHLDENKKEIALVKELEPSSLSYADCYDRYGLLSDSVMAHAIYLTPDERQLLKERGTFIAHCPDSNLNVCSGIAPIRSYLEAGMNVGLGSDVAGGSSTNLLRSMVLAIQVSKVYSMLVDPTSHPLALEDAFYLATLGGGRFFGKVGAFQEGYEADILVIDDLKAMPSCRPFSLAERLERFVYDGDERGITDKFVSGRAVDLH